MTDTTVVGGTIGIGGVFSRTFSVLIANFVPFLVICFLVLIPLLLFNLVLGGGMAMDPASAGLGFAIAALISMVLSYAAMGAVVYGTIAHLRGQPADIGSCISRGFSVIVTTVLVGIVVTILVALGMMLLIIPGIIVAVMTAVAVPAAVVERPGIWDSVKRSAELTKGNRWRVFALLVIFYVIMMAVGWGVNFAGLPVLTPDGTLFAVIVQYIWSALTTSFFAVFGAVIYHDLRVAKEGASTAQIAAVFD